MYTVNCFYIFPFQIQEGPDYIGDGDFIKFQNMLVALQMDWLSWWMIYLRGVNNEETIDKDKWKKTKREPHVKGERAGDDDLVKMLS